MVIIRMNSQILGHGVPRAVAVYVGPLLKKLIANPAIIDNDVRHMQYLEENKPPLAARGKQKSVISHTT